MTGGLDELLAHLYYPRRTGPRIRHTNLIWSALMRPGSGVAVPADPRGRSTTATVTASDVPPRRAGTARSSPHRCPSSVLFTIRDADHRGRRLRTGKPPRPGPLRGGRRTLRRERARAPPSDPPSAAVTRVPAATDAPIRWLWSLRSLPDRRTRTRWLPDICASAENPSATARHHPLAPADPRCRGRMAP